MQWLVFRPLLRTICQKVLCLVCYLLTLDCQVVIARRNASKQNWSPWPGFQEEAEKEITSTSGWDSRVSAGKHLKFAAAKVRLMSLFSALVI